MPGYELDKPADPPAGEPPMPPVSSSLLDDRDQPCPSCAKPLPPGTVLCMACGYDMLRGGKAKTTLGEEILPEPVQPIVRTKGLSQKAATIIGLFLLAIAMFLAIWFCKPETYIHTRILRGLLVAVEAIAAIGTGMVAIWFASWVGQRPYGPADLAAARLLPPVAVFLLCFNLYIPVPVLGIVLKLAGAVGLYYFLLLALIGRDARTTQNIALAHAATTIIILMQSWLWSATADAYQW